jgi:hypothetical protein
VPTTGGHQHFLRPRRGEPSSRRRHGPLPRQERPHEEEDPLQERQRRRLACQVPSLLYSCIYFLYSSLLLRVRSCVCVCGRDQWLMMAMVVMADG